MTAKLVVKRRRTVLTYSATIVIIGLEWWLRVDNGQFEVEVSPEDVLALRRGEAIYCGAYQGMEVGIIA